MKRELIEKTPELQGQAARLAGWVHNRRDHGKIIFIDLRDCSGIIQVVFTPADKEIYQTAETLRPEWVISVEGQINGRPKGMENPEIKTGQIEMAAQKLEILNPAATPPFAIDTDGLDIKEEARMKYRYLDLRRERMKNNLILRHRMIKFMRDFLSERGFLEIETPDLTKGTPEGAREFVIPARLHPGKFYVLPQSPQQFKQLLMVAGLEKYFQVARCFRDEDQRGDRQPEFTQLDLEMSFVEREDVMALTESLLTELVKTVTPEKRIQETPFPVLSYKEAMEKYKTDKPDLRRDKKDPSLLAFCWIVDFPFFEKTDEGGWTFTHNPFSAAIPEHRQWLMEKKNIGEILTSQYDIALNGFEVGGGSIRNHRPEALHRVFEIMGLDEERIQSRFGHMLEAFNYGAPPHGGIAPGIDRLVMILAGEANIREVMAFPKTGDARDLMMGAPSEIDPKQLKEAHIKTI